jgi:hypothetical protein
MLHMTAARIYSLLLLLVVSGFAGAQNEPSAEPEGTVPAAVLQPERKTFQLAELENVTLGALRQQFARPSGIIATTSVCRIPDYGPMINISLQLPPIYFTRPLLIELEKRSREAEAQASRVREQIDRAAQVIRMKTREAELLQQIELEQNRKKNKATVVSLQNELTSVRKNISDLEGANPVANVTTTHVETREVDLEKMMTDSYEDAFRRIYTAMQNVLLESAANLEALQSTERLCIATHIRESFLTGQQRTILFILNPSDIEDFRSGRLDRAALRQKIVVKEDSKE